MGSDTVSSELPLLARFTRNPDPRIKLTAQHLQRRSREGRPSSRSHRQINHNVGVSNAYRIRLVHLSPFGISSIAFCQLDSTFAYIMPRSLKDDELNPFMIPVPLTCFSPRSTSYY